MKINFKGAGKAVTGIAAAATVTFGGFALNERSNTILAPTSPEIQAVTRCAATKPITLPKGGKVTFVVYHGFRTDAEQRSMLAKGVSWVNRSRHQDGEAVDVMAVVPVIDALTGKSIVDSKTGKPVTKGTWAHEPYYEIAKAFYKCGEELGVPITWGGEWTVGDFVHFEKRKKK